MLPNRQVPVDHVKAVLASPLQLAHCSSFFQLTKLLLKIASAHVLKLKQLSRPVAQVHQVCSAAVQEVSFMN